MATDESKAYIRTQSFRTLQNLPEYCLVAFVCFPEACWYASHAVIRVGVEEEGHRMP